MKKYILFTYALILFRLMTVAQLNSNWQFIGPYSENALTSPDNKFQTSRLQAIAVNPANSRQMFTSGWNAGLWETTDGGDNWNNIETSSFIGSNGIGAIAVSGFNELFVANCFDNTTQNSTGLFKYTLTTRTWQPLGSIPNANNFRYRIRRIIFSPANPNEVFLCTTIGLFKSNNRGLTWALVDKGNICNIVFLKKQDLSGYHCIISGVQHTGSLTEEKLLSYEGQALLKVSTDGGNSFTEMAHTINTEHTDKANLYANICLGDVSNPAGPDLYIHCVTNKCYLIYKIQLNAQLNVQTCRLLKTYTQDSHYPQRNAIQYDPVNKVLWLGAVKFYDYNLTTGITSGHNHVSVLANDKRVHDDIYDILIKDNVIFIASDGGFYSGLLADYSQPFHNFFRPRNKGLHISLINGFSGASYNPDYYLLGYQDIVYTDFYDAKTKKVRYTHPTWENDGGLIDKFNNNIVLADRNSYSGIGGAYVFVNGGKSFLPDVVAGEELGGSFGVNSYYQDPFRERIYYGAIGPTLFQYNFSRNDFEMKSRFQWITGGDLWNAIVESMAFSRQDANSVHLTTGTNIANTHAAQVLKYIGPDFNNSYMDHNEWDYDCGGGRRCPQWENITPNWGTLSNLFPYGAFTRIPNAELYKKFRYPAIVKSPLDKNVVYISCSVSESYPFLNYNEIIPGNPMVKVLKYDGSKWINYSLGIPPDENPGYMVMDVYSNDGIYLATEKGLYYRDANMPQWLPYNANLPKMLVKQMEISYQDRTVRAATFGRGIWKSPLKCPAIPFITETGTYNADRIIEANKITSTALIGPDKYIIYRGGASVELKPGFQTLSQNGFKEFTVIISNCR